MSGNAIDGLIPIDQEIEDPAPRGTADGVEHFRFGFGLKGRSHGEIIGKG
jgi:hypothetical protein